MSTTGIPALVLDWAAAAAPPPAYTVSEWADAERILPESSAARGSRWRTADTPYLRGFMDAVLEPGVRRVVFMKAAQIGGSEGLHNILGYFIAHEPCPTLFVQPSLDVAEEWSKERLADMIETTPALRQAIRTKRGSRSGTDGESTLLYKTFPGGYLALGGANSPNTFARRAVRLAIGDDVDRFPATLKDEGDPAALLENRITTFLDGLVLLVSTPTLKDGRIDTAYRRSDQRRYVVTCPACGYEDWITWQTADHFRVVYDGEDASSARLACPDAEHGGCGARHDELTRRAMVLGGAWRATAVAKERGLIGFHAPAMISTLGEVTLARLVEKWLAAISGGREALKAFVTTVLGEPWEDRTAKVEPNTLLYKREEYGTEGAEVDAPAGVAVLTAGVDVQIDRFELQIIGWGLAGERWVLRYDRIPGDPKDEDVQAALLQALAEPFRHACGQNLIVEATAIDTGTFTDAMYAFVNRHQARRLYAIKGFGGRGGGPIVGKAKDVRTARNPRPVRLYPINVDDAKGDILAGVLLPGPPAPGVPMPQYMHFPVDVDEEYFAQLCAEHREPKYNKAKIATHTAWVQDRERNEALDTAVYALAAFKILNPNIRARLEQLGGQAPTPSAPPPAAAKRDRWLGPRRGGWLKR